MTIQSIKDLESIKEEYRLKLNLPDAVKVNIGMASCGIAAGAKDSFDAAQKAFGQDKTITICQTGCLGYCEVEPLVEVIAKARPRMMFKNVTEDIIVDLINAYTANDFSDKKTKKHILGQVRDPRSLLEEDMANPQEPVAPVEGIPFLEDTPFFKGQVKIALRNCGYVDPDSIEDYFGKQGYLAFLTALKANDPRI